jgi:hypothetical protein
VHPSLLERNREIVEKSMRYPLKSETATFRAWEAFRFNGKTRLIPENGILFIAVMTIVITDFTNFSLEVGNGRL